MDRLVLGLLGAGHLSVDLCQGAVPAMLPFFIRERRLSYAAAAGLVLAQTVSSSVLQPLFGQLTDRRPLPWLLAAGVAVAGIGLGAAPLMPSYELIWLAVAVSGVGVAAYHPEGARYAGYASGDRKATGMSVFSVGGNAGFASGPVLATPLLLLLGLRGGWTVAVLPVAVAAALAIGLRRIDGHRPGAVTAAGGARGGVDRWWPFLRVGGAQVCRSVLFYGLNTFIPLYWIGVLHQPPAAAAVALATLLLVGIVGNLVGGRLADRFPRQIVVVGSFALTAPIFLALLLVRDPLLANLLLVPLALAMYAAGGVMVVLGQEYLPNRVGTASGVNLGLAVSVGGIVTPGLGFVADHAGLHQAMLLLAVVPLAATALTLGLPEPNPR
jgi:MFS transporter, FSR family, fosmidomycin resistance protein